jgi:hypothetical protein
MILQADRRASHQRHKGSTMPRFYFHTETDVRMTDHEGMELEGFVDARKEAIRTCGQMMRDAPEVFWGSRPWNVSVTDAGGLILWVIYVDGVTSAAAQSFEPKSTKVAGMGPEE